MAAALPHELTQAIKARARSLGFVRVGIATVGPARTHRFYQKWVAAGFAGPLAYLRRHVPLKGHPHQVASAARSVISLAAAYSAAGFDEASGGLLHGRVSRYARGRDYHDVLTERLRKLAAFIEEQTGHPVTARPAVDSAPLLEREWAVRAGLGWVGRNAMLIDREWGSYLFLAELLVDVQLVPDAPEVASSTARKYPSQPSRPGVPEPEELGLRESCGSCRACITACPTGAIVGDKAVDARRCISTLTIELKGAVPRDLRSQLGDWVFGCDVCQEVCPWNQRTPPAADQELSGAGDAGQPSLITLLGLDAAGFRQRYRHTAVWRTRRRGLLRNAAIALGNAAAKMTTVDGAPAAPAVPAAPTAPAGRAAVVEQGTTERAGQASATKAPAAPTAPAGRAAGKAAGKAAREIAPGHARGQALPVLPALASLDALAAVAALAQAQADPEPVVRGAAAWALGCYGIIGGRATELARQALLEATQTETDPAVLEETAAALAECSAAADSQDS